MKITEKIIAFFMTAVLITTSVPFGVFADDEKQKTQTQTQLSIESGSPIADMVKAQSDSQPDDTGGYNVSALEVYDDEAAVEISYEGDCTLIAAVYDEKDGRMIASGSQSVKKTDEGGASAVVWVDLEGETLPKYFTAKAFLVNSGNAPLCKAFETKEYTEAFAEFYAKTPNDFDSDRVKEFNGTDGDDFFVASENAVTAESDGVHNIVEKSDDENKTYTISNADGEIKKLKAGDVLYYPYGSGDNDYILIKISSADKSGDKVTLTGTDDVSPSELFEYIKIDEYASDGTLDTSGTEDYLTVVENSEAQTFRSGKRTLDSDVDIKDTYKNEVKLSYDLKGVKVSGSLAFSLGYHFKLFFDFELFGDKYFYLESVISFDTAVTASIAVKGDIIPAIPICKWGTKICGVGVEIKISFVTELTFSTEFVAKQSNGRTGFAIDAYSGYKDKSKAADSEFKPDGKGSSISIFAGLKFEASATLLKHIDFSFSIKCGVSVSGKIYPDYVKKDVKHPYHTSICLDCELSLNGSIGYTIKFFDKLSLDNTFSRSIKLLDFYVSSEPSFGLGDCPYMEYKITFEVFDENNNPVENAQVGDDETNVTDEDGKVSIFLSSGTYSYIVTAPDGRNKNVKFVVLNDKKDVTVKLDKGGTDPEPDPDLPTGDIIDSGSEGSITWVLYEDGTLVVSGEGAIPNFCFSDDDRIKKAVIEYGITSIGSTVFYYCTKLTNVIIPDSVTSISSQAFTCTSLKSIRIPDSVSYICEGCFEGSGKLEEIIVDENNSFYSSVDGVLFNKSQTEIIAFPGGREGKYIIPDGVTNIGASAFESCYKLTEVVIPNGVKKIDGSAFCNCGLTRIVIPDCVTSIGDWAFHWCGELEEVTIPESVTSIGAGAFGYCSNLKSIIIPNSVTYIGESQFEECNSLEQITVEKNNSFYASVDGVLFNKSKTELINYPGGRKGKYTVPNGVTKIGNDAFSGCKELTEVIIPSCVTEVGDWAFHECHNLVKAVIPNSITKISEGMFSGCHGLKSITIPNSVISIKRDAFSICTELRSITIPDSVTSIEFDAFGNCDKLEKINVSKNNSSYSSINGVLFDKSKTELIAYPCGGEKDYVIPDGVTNINDYAFEGCYDLMTITIPNSVIYIGWRAFDNFNSLKRIYYTGSEEQWNDIYIETENDDLISADIIYNYIPGTKEDISEPYSENYSEEYSYCSAINSKPTAKRNTVKSLSLLNSMPNASTAELSNAEIGYDYLFIVVKDMNAENIFDSDNLLYINQYTADSAVLSVSYVPSSDYDSAQTMFIKGVFEPVKTPVTPVDPDPVKPTDPVNPTEPVKPTEPEKPTDPVKPTEPATKPNEPATKPTEPVTKPTEPAVKPTDPTTEPTTKPALALGDLNGDGKITAADARTALRVAAKLETVSDEAMKAGDLDSDGRITAKEARTILRFAAKLISSLV